VGMVQGFAIGYGFMYAIDKVRCVLTVASVLCPPPGPGTAACTNPSTHGARDHCAPPSPTCSS
jgi:hypothetical protein